MKTSHILLLSVLGFILMAFLIIGGSYVNAYNKGNVLEKNILATYTNNQNVLSTYYQKIEEVVQVPTMMKEDLMEVISSSLSGRYGDKGAEQVFLFVKENYPGQVDAGVYQKIQQIIESGRNDFRNAQTRLIDQKRLYETELGFMWSGMWLRIAGYPKIDLNNIKVVVNEKASDVFETGVEKSLKLR